MKKDIESLSENIKLLINTARCHGGGLQTIALAIAFSQCILRREDGIFIDVNIYLHLFNILLFEECCDLEKSIFYQSVIDLSPEKTLRKNDKLLCKRNANN